MNLKISNAQNPAEVLKGWQGICREFGCSEEQLRELYRASSLLSGDEYEPELLSEAEFAEQVWRGSSKPPN
jgi:hypothetical protein